MRLLITTLFVARAAALAAGRGTTALTKAEQDFLDSVFNTDTAGSVSSDPSGSVPLEGVAAPSCRCVPADCCAAGGGLTSGQGRTAGVGSLDARSGPGSRTAACERGDVCCREDHLLTQKTGETNCGLAERLTGTGLNVTGGASKDGKSQCGTRQSIAAQGDSVAPGQFPWLVTIQDQRRGTLLGAGALLHPRLVITAAHIVEHVAVSSLRVRLADRSAELAVSQAELHADWAGRARYHDLAVLLLAEEAPLSPAVMPACLGPATLDPGAPLQLDGCQTVQITDGMADSTAGTLRTSSLRLLSRSGCEAGLKATGKLPDSFGLHYSFICANASVGEESACRTESGAPLTCDDPDRPGGTVLVGLLSWNAACRGLGGWPDVYTRLADVDNFCWLERTATTMLQQDKPFFGEALCVLRSALR